MAKFVCFSEFASAPLFATDIDRNRCKFMQSTTYLFAPSIPACTYIYYELIGIVCKKISLISKNIGFLFCSSKKSL